MGKFKQMTRPAKAVLTMLLAIVFAFSLVPAAALVAAAMGSDVQTLDGFCNMPDPALYGHAGVYAYLVAENGASAPADWHYSQALYKARVYVKNGANGLEYATPTVKIESLRADDLA